MPDVTDLQPVDPWPPRVVIALIFRPSSVDFDWDDFDVETIDFTRLDSLEIAALEPPPGVIQGTAGELFEAGFKIEARTEVGLSVSGTRHQFVQLLGFDPLEHGRGRAGHSVVPVTKTLPPRHPGGPVDDDDDDRFPILRGGVVAFEVATPGVLASGWGTSVEKPVPADLDGLRDCLEIQGEGGLGVHVRLVDSGLAKDWSLTSERPPVHAIGELDPTCDESGHGTAVAAHVLAIAPKCTLSMRKCVDESGVRNYPIAAFQHAVGTYPDPSSPDVEGQVPDRPDVILCSWVIAGTSLCLQLEIANAIRQKILVVFASGNSTMHDEAPQADNGITPFIRDETVPVDQVESSVAYQLCPVAHPEVLSVGGMTKSKTPGEKFEPSDYTPLAAGFDSEAFVYPKGLRRSCPDIAGLTAPMPDPSLPFQLPGLINTPTSKGSTMDQKPDGGSPDDGLFKSAGTSMAAGQIAGIAALLIEAEPSLRRLPASVKNVLTNTARHDDLHPWHEKAGHGLAYANGAKGWLANGCVPFVRQIADPVDPATFLDSPDIILLGSADPFEASRRLGQSFKHLGFQNLDDEGGRYAFVRVQNRGRLGGDCRVTLAKLVGLSITILGEAPVSLEPGCFVVVGPFYYPQGLGSPLPPILVAEAVPVPADQPPKPFEWRLTQLIPGGLAQIKQQFAFRGVSS